MNALAIVIVDGKPEAARAVRQRFPAVRLFALDRRRGKAENDTLLLCESRGRFCLLLNEDSVLLGFGAFFCGLLVFLESPFSTLAAVPV